jgi:hypothetical protein
MSISKCKVLVCCDIFCEFEDEFPMFHTIYYCLIQFLSYESNPDGSERA